MRVCHQSLFIKNLSKFLFSKNPKYKKEFWSSNYSLKNLYAKYNTKIAVKLT